MIIPLHAERRSLSRPKSPKVNAGSQNKARTTQRKIQQRDDSTTPGSGGGGLNSGVGVAITFGIVIVVILTVVIIRYSIKRKSQSATTDTLEHTPRRGHSRQHSDDRVLLAASPSNENTLNPRLVERASPTNEQNSEDLPPRYDQVIRAPPHAHQRGSGSTAATIDNDRGRRSGAWRVSVMEGNSRSSR